LALFALHEAIGDQAFKKSGSTWKILFQSVKTQDFFDEVNKVSDLITELVKYGLSLRYLITLQSMSY
jgi:hypothetical protein